MNRKSIALLISTSMLGACYGFRGPEPVILRGNVVHQDRGGQRTGYLYERFRIATLAAAECGVEPQPQFGGEVSPVPPPVTCQWQPPSMQDAARAAGALPDEATQTAQRRRVMADFMRAGYELIYADCADYFAAMGRRQGGTRIARASIGPIGDLITQIISIVSFENAGTREDLTTLLAAGTSAATAALNIYDQHFLFGADNIDEVRRLVQDALRAHAAATFGTNVDHDTFGRAANHLEDNQAICRPSRILTLVREAIAAGQIEARTIPTTQTDESVKVEGGGQENVTQSDAVDVGVRQPR
jgi:hypothetical protein